MDRTLNASRYLAVVASRPSADSVWAQRITDDMMIAERYKAEATITFGQFIKECWEPAVVPHLKASSVRYYGLQIRCHLLPKFGVWKIKDITKAEVQRFLADKRKQGLSSSSVHGMRTALGKVLQASVDWNYLEHNTGRGIRLGDRVPVQERAYLLPKQLSLLLTSLSEPCRTLALVVTLTGLRIGELLALRWNTSISKTMPSACAKPFTRGILVHPKPRAAGGTCP